MSDWLAVPIVLPAMMAGIIVLALRHDIVLQRVASLTSTIVCLVVCVGLLVEAASGTIAIYELGDWPAPFGIVLVMDRLSALLVTLTSFLAVMVLLYALSGWDQRGRHFHARMFAPTAGIFEDPATGSGVAALTGAIMRFDEPISGSHEFVVEQGFEMGRPSLINLELDVSAGRINGARIGGDAVVVARGTFSAG